MASSDLLPVLPSHDRIEGDRVGRTTHLFKFKKRLSEICSQEMIQPNPENSQEFSRIDKPHVTQRDSTWLNVTQRDSEFKRETTSFHPLFSEKHLHPRVHCIEGSLPAMALALRLLREKSGN